MDPLINLPEFSVFRSGIKFHGKSILPPIISNIARHEIHEFRRQASIIQNKVEEQSSRRKGLLHQLDVLHSKVELSKASTAGLINKNSQPSDETLPFVSNSSSSLIDICEEEEEDLSVISSANQCRVSLSENRFSEQVAPAQSNPAFTSPPNSPSPELNFAEMKTESEAVKVTGLHEDCFGIRHFQKNDSMSSVGSDSSEDLLGPDDEYQSLVTVIENKDVGDDNNLDRDSIVTSVAQSSDLENYLDCSVEDGESSQRSLPVVNVLNPLIRFSPSTSAETAVDFSGSSTPVLTSLMPLVDAGGDSDVYHGLPVIERELTSSANRLPDIPLLYLNSKQLTPSNVEKPVNLRVNLRAKSVPEDARSKHKRNHSYTIELPSPVLLESHANCPCLTSPSGSDKPHSTSIILSPAVPEDFRNLTVADDEGTVSVKDCRHANTVSMPDESLESKDKSNELELTCDNRPSKSAHLDKLFEHFKKEHDKKVERLLQEQHNQWLQLQLEFKEQELEIQAQFDSLVSLDVPGVAAIQDFNSPRPDVSSDSTRISQDSCRASPVQEETAKPKTCQEVSLEATTYSIPSMQCCSGAIHYNPKKPCSRHLISSARRFGSWQLAKAKNQLVIKVPKIAGDPDMKKKFEKVTACAKGFLTRRLYHSSLVRSIKDSIVESAELLTAIFTAPDGGQSVEDKNLQERLVLQINKAFRDVHHVFFGTSVKERMQIISQSRECKRATNSSKGTSTSSLVSQRSAAPLVTVGRSKLSSATLKRLERKSSKDPGSSRDRLSKSTENCRVKKGSPTKNCHTPKKSPYQRSQGVSATSLKTSKRKCSSPRFLRYD